MKNRKNDRSDASLQVYYKAIFIVRSGARPPIREAILPRSISLRGMVSKRGPHCPSTRSQEGSWKPS
jgi:hypothetical protein